MPEDDKKKEAELRRQADEFAERFAASHDFLKMERQAVIRSAQAGDRRAARAILREFAAIVGESSERTWAGPIPFEFAQFLSEAFRLITLNGLDVDKALGLRAGDRGRPKDDPDLVRLTKYRYCLQVLRLKATGKYSTWEEAKTVTARKRRVSKSTIDKAWKSTQRIAAEMEFRRRLGKKTA